MAINDNKVPERRFYMQRYTARKRNISFLLNFEEWWKLWQDSGKWNLCGKHRGQYCMARYGDAGAYEVGNVRICRMEENVAEAPRNPSYGKSFWHHLTPAERAERLAAISARRKGARNTIKSRIRMSEVRLEMYRRTVRNDYLAWRN